MHRAHVIETTSFWLAAPPYARVACESHDGPNDPRVSWALRAPEARPHSSDVLACPGAVWERFIVLDDPLVHIAGYDARTPTVSVALDLSLELRAFLLELESCFLELLVPGLLLLHLQAGP